MGIFTWTDATVEHPLSDHYGNYDGDITVGYDSYVKLVCPDNTELETFFYEGYGEIGGRDVYELVTEWNRSDLKKIFEEKEEDLYLLPIVNLYADGKSDEEIRSYISVSPDKYASYLLTDWKREIGIAIACYDVDAAKLRYPLKITKYKYAHGYDSLYMSHQCQ